jgi:hypothetical protein
MICLLFLRPDFDLLSGDEIATYTWFNLHLFLDQPPYQLNKSYYIQNRLNKEINLSFAQEQVSQNNSETRKQKQHLKGVMEILE